MPIAISDYNQQLISFLNSSPTPFHAVEEMGRFLAAQGFQYLPENRPWQLTAGKSYWTCREKSALIAFTLAASKEADTGFRFLAAHTDSPCLQIKPRPEAVNNGFYQLGVELYGGPLLNPWFDRDLSLAGRVCGPTADGKLAVLLVDFRRPLLTIPSVAIHFDREANSGRSINQQQHLPPILGLSAEEQPSSFPALLLARAKEEHPAMELTEIFAYDIFCYDSQPAAISGINGELLSSARLDNLLSCHAGMRAIADAGNSNNALLFCANHEENGSRSATGAHSSFIDAVLERIIPDPGHRRIALSNSFLVSMDNAHASHPNHPDKMDKAHPIRLNHGPVIKINANQRYVTNSISAAIFKHLCREAGLTPQEFVMRSDMPCGSTIGPITAARLGVRAIDIGAPSLAMHSIREHTGSLDPFLLYSSIRQFLAGDSHLLLQQ